jgi:hypothetical protein
MNAMIKLGSITYTVKAEGRWSTLLEGPHGAKFALVPAGADGFELRALVTGKSTTFRRAADGALVAI